MLYAIAAVLLVLWILGFTIGHLGALVHLLLVAAVIVLVFNLVTGRGAKV